MYVLMWLNLHKDDHHFGKTKIVKKENTTTHHPFSMVDYDG
jgi:hypothetical protein